MNHPHKSQSAAMDRAGELPDGEQLRECINSGQVSAAQVVAHAEAGELPVIGYADPQIFNRLKQAIRVADYLSAAKEDRYTEALVKLSDATTALAAKQEEVARLRALLTRYRNETPLGNQPHMIAHEVDAILTPNQGETE